MDYSTDLHLSEHLSEGFSSRLHQLSVKSAADRERFGPHELEASRVLLEEIQSLGRQNSYDEREITAALTLLHRFIS